MVAYLGWVATAAGAILVWFVPDAWDSGVVAATGIAVGCNAYLNGKRDSLRTNQVKDQ